MGRILSDFWASIVQTGIPCLGTNFSLFTRILLLTNTRALSYSEIELPKNDYCFLLHDKKMNRTGKCQIETVNPQGKPET